MLFEHGPAAPDIKVTEHDVAVNDEFIDDKFEAINAEVERLASIGTDYYQQLHPDGVSPIERKRTSKLDLNNPATKEMIDTYPSFASWLSTVPTAEALNPLYAPDEPTFPNGVAIDEASSEWFRNIADARGIRSRAEVMKGLLAHEALTSQTPQRWLSLACGAAQPVFSVMEEVREEGAPTPHVTLVDIDKKALELAHRYAMQNNLESNIETKRLNVLLREGLTYRRDESLAGVAKSALLRMRGRLPAESYDAVDAVGILEYLKRPNWKYTYKGVISTTHMMAGAETFLQNAYELVKPGGMLIIGNMLDTHPQLDFTLNVVQWPHIQPRSVKEMITIITAVGIEGDIDVYKPSDGVYALYGIRKPY